MQVDIERRLAVGQVESLVEKQSKSGSSGSGAFQSRGPWQQKLPAQFDLAAGALKRRHLIDLQRALRLSTWLAFNLEAGRRDCVSASLLRRSRVSWFGLPKGRAARCDD